MQAGESSPTAAATGQDQPGQLPAVLNRFDWQLGEVGRRQHRFAWLRDPSTDEWIVVDAYYAGNHVVVIASTDPDVVRLCEQLIPEHSLFVLTVDPADLGGEADTDAVAKAMRTRLAEGGWQGRDSIPFTPTVAVETASAPRSSPPAAPSGSVAPQRPSGRPRTQADGLKLGAALVVAVVIELYVGFVKIGLGDGDVILGFGLLLDACARTVGMIAGAVAGDLDGAWTSVLFGSPALWSLGDEDFTGNEPAKAARLTAIAAAIVVAFGLVFAVL